MKTCTKCKIQKSFAEFSKASREKDGYQHRCKQCNKIISAEYRKNNVEKEKLRHAKYHAENKETINAKTSKWQKENPDKAKEKSRRFDIKNPHKRNKRASIRRARMANAYVSWANQDKIEDFYIKARHLTLQTGIQHHVDHIIPIKNEFVCGLHNEFNLQVITAFKNLSKHNRFMPG